MLWVAIGSFSVNDELRVKWVFSSSNVQLLSVLLKTSLRSFLETIYWKGGIVKPLGCASFDEGE